MSGIIYFLGAMAIAGIVYSKVQETEKGEGDKTDTRFYTVVVDSCEYVVAQGRYAQNGALSITHKGNCRNH